MSLTGSPIPLESLRLEKHGAQLFAKAIDPDGLTKFELALTGLPPDRAGIRLHGIEALRPLLSKSSLAGAVPHAFLGDACQPVRAIFFDKTETANWSLAWHQDRTIAVAARCDVPGFDSWTVKSGLLHVEPPLALLQTMITLRIHLDPVSEENAPLLIAPGSHRLGRIAEGKIASVVDKCGKIACLAERGDVWCYATPILHASAAAVTPTRRRVLQLDYAATALPGGLEWLGV